MRKIFVTIFCLLIIQKLEAQIDTTLRNYFPLEIGNYWEYRDNLFNLWKISAIKDTIMPNGKQYILFKDSTDWVGGNIQFNYYRIDDSMRVWEYTIGPGSCDDEYLIFDFTLPDSTLWSTCRELVIDYEHNFPALLWTLEEYYPNLSLLTTSKTFSGAVIDTISGDTCYCGSFYYTHYKIAKSIGLVYRAAEAGNIIYITGAIIRGVKYGTIVNVSAEEANFKDEESNFEIYPNPFNAGTVINYELVVTSEVTIKIYDVLGNEIIVLSDEEQTAGRYSIVWNGKDKFQNQVSSGIYFINLTTPNYNKIIKGVIHK